MDETPEKSDSPGRVGVLPYPEDQPVVSLWPVAGTALGLRRSSTFNAYQRNELPFEVWKIRGRLVVPTAVLRAALRLPQSPPSTDRVDTPA